MGTLVKIVVALIISLATYSVQAQESYSLTIKVDNVDSNEGKILIAIYNSESNFLEETFKGTKGDINNNKSAVTFKNIPEGTYAVSLFHDENNNDKLDSNFIGIPKEDYGCSNGAKGFFGPPKWKDAKFELKSDKTITITL